MPCRFCSPTLLCPPCQALLDRATQGLTQTPALRLPRPELTAEDMAPEWRFQARIVQVAEAQGFRVFHSNTNKRNKAGYWDLTMVRAGWKILCIEVKTNTGVVEPEQQAWLDAAKASRSDVVADVWRPKDWQRILTLLGY